MNLTPSPAIEPAPENATAGIGVMGLTHLIGRQETARLCRCFGGLVIRFRRRPRPDLVDCIGIEAAQRLCHEFKGCDVYIPKGFWDALRQRNRQIVSEYDQGGPRRIQWLAKRYALSERQIWNILKQTW